MDSFISSKKTQTALLIIIILVVVLVIMYIVYSVLNKNKKNTQQSCNCSIPSEKKEEFAKENKKNKICLYYADWCGHCKNFLPEWKILKNKIESTDLNTKIEIKEYNCENDEQLCKKENVRGYPTVILHKIDGNNISYEGGRTAADVLNFLNAEI
jgi:thiol-disulfide isomerase/thioredoxin